MRKRESRWTIHSLFFSLTEKNFSQCKVKCYYAHQIGMSQLAVSGAPVVYGKQYEPDSLKPLLEDVVDWTVKSSRMKKKLDADYTDGTEKHRFFIKIKISVNQSKSAAVQ